MNNSEAAPKPGYYAVIPASVRYCSDLPPAAKLMFGEVTALCSVEGFCWASNSYFCELYSVDRATVQRWLAALSKAGFVRVELVPGTGQRRIYDMTIHSLTPPQKRGGGAAKMPPPRGKNAARSITLITKENITSELSSCAKFIGPGPVAARDLQAQEGTVSASPSTLKSNSGNPRRVRAIEQAVAKCGDTSARVRFSEIWDLADVSGCGAEVWRNGLDAVNVARGTSTGFLGGLAAIFIAAVKSGIEDACGEVSAAPANGLPVRTRRGVAAAASLLLPGVV